MTRLQELAPGPKLVLLVLLSLPGLLPWGFSYFLRAEMGIDTLLPSWPELARNVVAAAFIVLPMTLPVVAIPAVVVLRGPKLVARTVILINLVGVCVMLHSCTHVP